MAERAEDLNLPMTVISRIIKESIPEGAIVSKEARTAISRAASVFVLHTTNYANQNALAHKRKTITAQDVIEGVKELEMEDFVGPLEAALEVWRENQKVKAANKKKAGKKSEQPTEELEEGDFVGEKANPEQQVVFEVSDESGHPSGSPPASSLSPEQNEQYSRAVLSMVAPDEPHGGKLPSPVQNEQSESSSSDSDESELSENVSSDSEQGEEGMMD